MKALTAVLTTLYLSLATARSLSLFASDQHVLDDDLSVPGENPLTFCQKADDYTLTISKVDLTPNPPSPGKTLKIEAKGNFTKEIVEGAYINLSVKYGLITLINQRADLCEQMENVDEKCPLEGVKTITKEVNIPKEVPPGKYTVLADVYDEDDKPITCLKATVSF